MILRYLVNIIAALSGAQMVHLYYNPLGNYQRYLDDALATANMNAEREPDKIEKSIEQSNKRQSVRNTV
ncbi:hypothetical protein GJ496_010243 [Pomphorhynchus laevis]|nr:hypothetical protein GJ496_010243 [Pomphorhynchus laevis]